MMLYPLRMPVCVAIFCASLWCPSASGQVWGSANVWSGVENEWVTEAAVAGDFIAMAGSFQGEIEIGGVILQSQGGFDIFLAVFSSDSTLIHVLSAGGPEDDSPTALAVTQDGSVLLGGEFTDQLLLGDTALSPISGSSGIFIVGFDSSGQMENVMQWSGTGLEQLTGLCALPGGGFAAAGYFSDTLKLPDTVVIANSNPAAFLSVHHTTGLTKRVHVIGETGNARASALTMRTDGQQIFMAGNYQGTVSFAGETLTASASGTDIFIVSVDEEGNPLWMTGAKGAWDDQVTALSAGESDALYLTGYAVGNLTFSDEIAIQSADLREDIFVARYRADGHPVWAVALQDPGEETGQAVISSGSRLYVAGRYSETFTYGGQSLVSPSGLLQSVLLALDTAGNYQYLMPIHASGLCLAEVVEVFPDGQPLVAGGFTVNLDLPPFQVEALGGFDAFWAVLAEQPTPVSNETPEHIKGVATWPNPASSVVHFKWPEPIVHWQLSDAAGRYLPVTSIPGENLDVKALPAGIYFLTAQGRSGQLYWTKVAVAGQ